MKNYALLLLVWCGCTLTMFGQETFPVNGVQDQRPHAYAFSHATIHVDDQTVLNDATLLIKEGKIIESGNNIIVPEGFVEVDLKGNHIYPSLIDIHTHYGIPEVKAAERNYYAREQIQSNTEGPYNANEAIKSEFQTFSEFKVDEKAAEKMREMGFGAVLTFRPDGISRGTSALVTLRADNENSVMIDDEVAAHYSFNKGSSKQAYPSSYMGYISLLRQTFMDAKWYQSLNNKPFTDKSLDAWNSTQSLPQIFEVRNWHDVLRADKLGDEFGVQYIIKCGTDTYQRLNEIKATNAALIVPLTFPDAYEVENPLDAYHVSLANMKHWELAPANLSRIADAGITFALTSDGLKNAEKFWPNVRKSIQYGLSESDALKALTSTPAKMLNKEESLGMIKDGYLANFIITSGPLFDKDTRIYENWIQGIGHVIQDMDVPDIAGNYLLTVAGDEYALKIDGKTGKQKGTLSINDSTEAKVSIDIEDQMVNLSFTPEDGKETEEKADFYRLAGWINGKDLKGRGQAGDGSWVDWVAAYQEDIEEKEKEDSSTDLAMDLGEVIYPFTAYGAPELPAQENLLIKGATVWTMEGEEPMEETDVYIENGKINKIGKDLSFSGATEIDGSGKHLTPGIVDEHSHIGASSINDVATNSSMVRIGDVVQSDDQEIYRALSGGVTAIQILHGSANPIGGQSALIKLRWGKDPEALKIEAADKYIKFALGENVKRSRSQSSIRYPQTRMGVEQVYVDAFTAALDYRKKWDAFEALSADEKAEAMRPRKDLAMEAMLEIIDGEMFISCHSYVQSEINMLMKVAEKFNFKVNTFTHILEGYKVADKMAAHGAGGSTFADWWAYKWEVRYAIPYNPAIMVREGVVTAVNSDNSEMMRRLNQEAAKSIKYGDLEEMEALKMVTLNPAKLLHLDDRMGSIAPGKDADVVLWSDHPLSIYAKAEKTIVDGIVYYDIERDQQLKRDIQLERARLIQKMQDAKSNGESAREVARTYKHHWHCDDVVISQQ